MTKIYSYKETRILEHVTTLKSSMIGLNI